AAAVVQRRTCPAGPAAKVAPGGSLWIACPISSPLSPPCLLDTAAGGPDRRHDLVATGRTATHPACSYRDPRHPSSLSITVMSSTGPSVGSFTTSDFR